MKPRKPLYEKFSGEELIIAEKIMQRRNQMLVHSRIYYILNDNIVSDTQWAKWGKELQELQEKYPKIAAKVAWHKEFEGWDASSGFHLPLDNEWIVNTANFLLSIKERNKNKQ